MVQTLWLRCTLACIISVAYAAPFQFEQQQFRSAVRDSAGVQVVEYAGSVKDLPVIFRIAARPSLDLGGEKQSLAEELSAGPDAQIALRLADGRIVVKDPTNLKVFSAQGRFLSTIGAVGDGPGEFRRLTGLCVMSGDSIVAIESRRAHVFSANGAHIRSFGTDAALEGSGCFSDGGLMVVADRRVDPAAPAYRVTTARRVGPTGQVLNEIGTFDAGGISPAIPLLTSSFVRGSLITTGDGRSAEIRVYRSTGGVARIIRWKDPGIPVTRNGFILLTQRVYSELSGAELDATVARALQRPYPAALPRYMHMKVDAAGRIWALDYPDLTRSGKSPPTGWTVFDSVGHPLGRVLAAGTGAAPGAEVTWIGRDEILLRWRDSTGFAHLAYHALERVR